MSNRSLQSCLVPVFALLGLISPLLAGEAIPRAQVGELTVRELSTPHPYPKGIEQTYEIHHPGATYIKVHFSKFELAPGDRLEVASPDGAERYFFEGRGYKQMGQDFWVNSVLGDTVVLRLQSVTGEGYGFVVDYYAAGTDPLFPPPPVNTESVCGANDWQDVACYETSYPTEFDRAKRAVVVLYNGTENCTGVKVGCPNQILTNEHCVTSQAEVNVTEVRFEFQNADCDGSTSSFSASYLGDQFITDDFTLDYSLITVEGQSDDYLAAEIDPRLPPVGERLYITGHPAGNPKKLSLEDSGSPTGLCQADISPIDGRGTDTDVGYFCDTTGGSSGSPVWSGESHKLIALHHFGGCANSGVRMDLIYPEIESLLTSCCDVFPNIPALTALPNGDNRIDLTWDDSDLDSVIEYRILRSRTQGGPYTVLAVVDDTSPGVAGGPGYTYVDTDVSGGITYHYVVRSSDGSTCTSDPSPETQATASGACTLPAIFAGVESVNNPMLGICTLELSWSSGISECGGAVGYNVYRSTIQGFSPGAGNRVASNIPGTTFNDVNQLVDGTTYYYVVRSVDQSNGVEDGNAVELAGAPVGQIVSGAWTDDAGDTDAAKLTPGSAWTIDGTEGLTGPAVYKTGAYADNTCDDLTTPLLNLELGSELTFWSHYDLEEGADKGEVQISIDGGGSWQRVPVNYPGSSTGASDACALPSGTYFTGSDPGWATYTADLSTWTFLDVLLRWTLSSDGANGGSGWWVDDITVSNVTLDSTCATGSACEDNPYVDVTPEGPLTVCQGDGPTLQADLTGGNGPFSYQWIRDGQPVPGATSSSYRPDDLGLHSYNVRAKADSCPDEVFDGLDTRLFRVNEPFFDGITAAVNPQTPTCSVDLGWDAAATVCDGPVQYYVYRDTTSPVAATPENLVAGSLTGTAHTDTHDLINLQTYHYLVRAKDASTGHFEANTIEASATPDGPGSGPQAVLDEDFEDGAAFAAEWTVTTGPGVHTCGEWAPSTSGTSRPSGGSGAYALANNECGGLLGRTSTTMTSPAVNVDLANLIGVTLEYDAWFNHDGNESASVEVFDGSSWVTVWQDTDSDINGHQSFDVTAYAAGNTNFQVRFDYQNATQDKWFAVDNVRVVALIDIQCATAVPGPPTVPDGSGAAEPLRGDRLTAAGDTIDVSWDAAACPATGYNLLYGDLANVAGASLLGGECAIGGSGSYTWSGVPSGSLYFLVVGTDGAATESGWGRNSGQDERNGSAASGQCGVSLKDPSNACY